MMKASNEAHFAWKCASFFKCATGFILLVLPLKNDDLALCSNEEQRRLVMQRYRTNYPDTPLEDSSYSYDSYSYSDSSLDDKDYLDLLNDIM